MKRLNAPKGWSQLLFAAPTEPWAALRAAAAAGPAGGFARIGGRTALPVPGVRRTRFGDHPPGRRRRGAVPRALGAVQRVGLAPTDPSRPVLADALPCRRPGRTAGRGGDLRAGIPARGCLIRGHGGRNGRENPRVRAFGKTLSGSAMDPENRCGTPKKRAWLRAPVVRPVPGPVVGAPSGALAVSLNVGVPSHDCRGLPPGPGRS